MKSRRREAHFSTGDADSDEVDNRNGGALFAAMPPILFRPLLAGSVMLAAVFVAGLSAPAGLTVEPARWFVPGASGYEPGRVSAVRRPEAQRDRGFLTRAMSSLAGEAQHTWARRNGVTEPLPFMHNLTVVFPVSLRATRPEFFPLVAGRRLVPRPGSYFWNPDLARPDVAAFAADAARRHFRAHPEAAGFALGINDGLVWGESPELLKLATPVRWFRERPNYSNLVFTFMNRVAAELAPEFPDKYVGALAYYWAEEAPDFALHRQVVPFLTADRSQGYDAGFAAEDLALRDRWVRRVLGSPGPGTARPRLGLYDYLDGEGFFVPRIYHGLLAENLRAARRAGFTDHFAEIPANWGLDPVTPWLVAQLTQDPEVPLAERREEFLRRYFGAAAGPMGRFYARAEAQWIAQPGPPYWMKHYRNESQAVVFPAASLQALRAELDEALAGPLAPRHRARVERVAAAFGLTERLAALHRGRDALARAALAARPDPVEVGNLLELFRTKQSDFAAYHDALRRRDPEAFYGLNPGEFLKNDPTTMAAAVLSGGAADMSGRSQLARNPNWLGPLGRGQRIAELIYGIDEPPEWASRVEPAEKHLAVWRDEGDARVLRIEGTKDSSIQQWVERGGARPLAQAAVRGRVSPGTIVSLSLAWLDVRDRHVGHRLVRLPDGDWPDWVVLRIDGPTPAGAVKVGIGIRVQHQVAGDWAEFRNLALYGAK